MAIFPAAGIAGLLGQASPYGAPLRQAAPTADQAVNQVQLRPRLPNMSSMSPLEVAASLGISPQQMGIAPPTASRPSLGTTTFPNISQGPIGMDGQAIFPLPQPSIVNTGDRRVVPAFGESVSSIGGIDPTGPAANLLGPGPGQPNIVDTDQGSFGGTSALAEQVLAANPNGLPNMTNTGGNPSDFLGIKATPRPSAGTFNADALASALPTVGGPMGSPLSSVEPDYTGFARPPAPSMNVPLAYDSFPVNRPSFDDFPVGMTGGGGLRPPPGGLFGFPGFPPRPSDPPNNYPGYGGGGSTGGGGGLMAEIPKAIEPVIQNASKSLNTGIGQIISKTMGTGGGSGPDYRVQDIVRPQNMQNLLLGGMF